MFLFTRLVRNDVKLRLTAWTVTNDIEQLYRELNVRNDVKVQLRMIAPPTLRSHDIRFVCNDDSLHYTRKIVRNDAKLHPRR